MNRSSWNEWAFDLLVAGSGVAAQNLLVGFFDQLRLDQGGVEELADNHFAPINAPQLTAEALLSLV
jgi:hypothetical protein